MNGTCRHLTLTATEKANIDVQLKEVLLEELVRRLVGVEQNGVRRKSSHLKGNKSLEQDSDAVGFNAFSQAVHQAFVIWALFQRFGLDS